MAKVKTPKRPIRATLFRKNQPVWERYYVRIDTAIRRAVHLAVIEGYPGDTVELSSSAFGYQIGTVKIHTQGRLTVNWTPLTDEI